MRPLRINAAGLFYHVMARGNGKRHIYLDAEDYTHFLRVLQHVVERFSLECHAYCEMPNHYHLAVRTTEPNLSSAIRSLNGAYAQWWNWRHETVGHVFQGRFKAQVVEAPGYFSNLVRYIMRNPLRAGLVDDLARWPWSSFHATAGRDVVPPFLVVERVLSMYREDDRRSQVAWFVEHVCGEYPHESRIADLVRKDARVIGSEEFRLRFADAARGASAEVPRRDRRCGEPSLHRLFKASVCSKPLGALILEAHERHGFPLADIAASLGLPVKTVSSLIRAAREKSASDLAPLTGRNET